MKGVQENTGEWTGTAEIRKAELLVVDQACRAVVWTVKERIFDNAGFSAKGTLIYAFILSTPPQKCMIEQENK